MQTQDSSTVHRVSKLKPDPNCISVWQYLHCDPCSRSLPNIFCDVLPDYSSFFTDIIMQMWHGIGMQAAELKYTEFQVSLAKWMRQVWAASYCNFKINSTLFSSSQVHLITIYWNRTTKKKIRKNVSLTYEDRQKHRLHKWIGLTHVVLTQAKLLSESMRIFPSQGLQTGAYNSNCFLKCHRHTFLCFFLL